MKNYISAKPYIILFTMLCLLLGACEKTNPTQSTRENPEDVLKRQAKWVDFERVALLSVKYKIRPSAVQSAIRAYQEARLNLFFEEAEKMLTPGDKTPTITKIANRIRAINHISTEYKIPADTLAAIIVDYKICVEHSKNQGNASPR